MMRLTRTVFLAATIATCSTAVNFEDSVRGAVMGSLVADALTLGTHYEYDAKKIRSFYGRIDRYYAPGEKTGGQTHGIGWGARNYHGGNGNGSPKRAGEQTDYGDYTLLILDHLASTAETPHAIELKELIPQWQQALQTWRSWICTQTRQTFQQVQQGVPFSQLGGNSNAMGIRGAAALGYYKTEEQVVAAFRTAMFTHRETSAHQGAEFFARVAFRVATKRLTPTEAIKEVAAESPQFIKTKVRQALEKVAEATDANRPLINEEFADDLALTSMARLWDVGKTEPIKVGKASPTEGTLPGSVYFIVKYENDFIKALESNAEVGGDNASRSMAIGMVLGAYHGASAIPTPLKDTLVEWKRADAALDKLPLLRTESPSMNAEL